MDEGSKIGKGRRSRERGIRFLFFGVALASITTLGLIALFLFVEGIPIFREVSITDFIFGKFWYPTDDPADFGIFPLIVASISVTAVSSVISIPLFIRLQGWKSGGNGFI